LRPESFGEFGFFAILPFARGSVMGRGKVVLAKGSAFG
jgi:hypothetical protein